jgi:IS30 family transposase
MTPDLVELIEEKLTQEQWSLSSDARCNTPRRFGIGRIETSGSVAMRGYSHLSDDEREQIGLLKVLGHSIGAIARAIRRPKSTISRELSRNRLPSGRYSPLHAAGAYQLRRRREALIEKDRALRSFVLDRLAEGWTPEQIAGWLKAGNERRLRAVGCETIYAFIYRAAQKAEQLWRYLTRRHKRRRPRRSRPSRDTIKDRVSIHERPENIDARTEAGHWEGDLIICKRTRPVLVLHERKSRVTLAARLVGKTAAETISVMLAVFARIEPTLRKSITFDNDTAFAQHARLKTMCAMTTWFCDAYASWQKGGVENANGRLRRWLPRQIDIDKVSDEEIQDIILTANLTPRKCLPEFRREVQCLSALNLLDFPFPGAAFASPKSSGRRRRRKENLAFPGEPEHSLHCTSRRNPPRARFLSQWALLFVTSPQSARQGRDDKGVHHVAGPEAENIRQGEG